MRKLLKFLRVRPDAAKLARAIEATAFAAMQKHENTRGFRERPAGMKKFFAKGRAGAWREDLTPPQAAQIRAAFLPTLERWYPEMLAETAEFAGAT